MLTIHLTRQIDSSVALRLRCPDALVFEGSINVLKFEIPPPYRHFDKFTKSWIILFEAAVELERYIGLMVAKYCADVLIEDEIQNGREETDQQKQNSSQRETGTSFERIRVISIGQAYAALYVTRDVPFEIVVEPKFEVEEFSRVANKQQNEFIPKF